MRIFCLSKIDLSDENGMCPPENLDCMTAPPMCERICEENSCVHVPVPLCTEVRVSKQVFIRGHA